MEEPRKAPGDPVPAPKAETGKAGEPPMHDPAPRAGDDTRRGAWIFGSILLVFLLGVFVFAPAELPMFKQRLLAFLSAVMAGLFGYFLTGALVVDASFQSPLVKVGAKAAGGFAMFVLVLLWWLMPGFAPVAVEPALHRVDVQVLDPGGRTVEQAEITSSPSGEILKTGSGWQVVLPDERIGDERKVTLRAAQPEAFLLGETTVELAESGTTTATLTLQPEPGASVEGRVVDAAGRGVPGALVYAGDSSTTTDESGGFVLATQAAEGQSVRLRAEKQGFRPADQWHPAGAPVTLRLLAEEG